MFPITYITRADLKRAAETLNTPVAVVQAVTAVEARKSGFIKGTDLPCILFEGHKFSAFTQGVYDRRHPTISYPKWTKEHYVGGRGEYDRLIEAIRINDDDPEPALKSASWGMFQIMGFNYADAGYGSVRAFVNAMSLGENRHLDAFVSFIQANDLDDELRSEEWARFAEAYNGPGYKANAYDVKLANAFIEAVMRTREETSGATLDLERGDAVKLQTALNVAINAGLVPDGWVGRKTREAIRKLQAREGWDETGKVDERLCAYLGLDVAAYLQEA